MYYVASAQSTRNNGICSTEDQGLQYIGNASGLSPCIASEYASLGYHFGKLLPMATVGHRNQWLSADKMKSAIPAGVLVPVTLLSGATLNAPADFVIDGLSQNPGVRLKDYFYEFGLRYDLTGTVALKLDFTFYQSHWKTSDFPIAALGGAVNPQDANRLLAAVTFSF